ncbi:MAG: metallophosphoesterase family protein [Clostridiales bacterium]|nr:metallophosphoesterase family protein [Clostridiales bacterium]
MKYAVISDVHGNAPALGLVLADAAKRGAQGYLLAGDYCLSAPWGREVVRMLRSLPGAHIISGNDDQHLSIPPGDDGQYEVSRWGASKLSDEDKAWLSALPPTLDIACEGTTIHMAHSSQTFLGKALYERFRTSVLPGFYPDGLVSHEVIQADFRRLWEQVSFRDTVHALQPGVYVFGHNHIQTWADFDGRILVNPGSCGLPLDCGAFGAAYSLLTIDNGCVTVEERRIPYDVEALIAQVRASKQYAAARVWSELIFSEWRTCREKVFQFLAHCERYATAIGDTRRPIARDTWTAAYAQWEKHARAWHPELFV